MFDLFSWSHILILLAVALVVVGPKDLPRLMNMAGKWAGKARNMANEFKKSFDDMARQSELDELRAEIEKLQGRRSGCRRDQRPQPRDPARPQSGGYRREPAAPASGRRRPGAGEYQISDSELPPDADARDGHEPETAAETETAAP